MRFVLGGRLRRPCPLTPAEYFTLAFREWETVIAWLERGRALAYGRIGAFGGGELLVEAASEAEASALAATLPFAPYAEVTVRRVDRAAGPDADVIRFVQDLERRTA